MVQHYSYRWLYAIFISIVVVITFGFNDIMPKWISLKQMNQTELKLTQEWQTMQKTIHHSPASTLIPINRTERANKKIDWLSMLVNLANMNHVVIRSLSHATIVSAYTSPIVKLHIIANAPFSAFTAFFAALVQQAYPFLLMDFSLKTESSSHLLLITIDMLLFPQGASFLQSDHFTMLNPSNPFCSSLRLSSSTNAANAMHTLPLALIHMVGYVKKNNQLQAYLSLPDGSLFAVDMGFHLGKENGVITAIQEDHLILQMPDRSFRKIAMRLSI